MYAVAGVVDRAEEMSPMNLRREQLF